MFIVFKFDQDPNASSKVVPQQAYTISWLNGYKGCFRIGWWAPSEPLSFQFGDTNSVRRCMTFCGMGINGVNYTHVAVTEM